MRVHRAYAHAIAVSASILLFTMNLSAGELEGRWRRGYWTDTNTGHEDMLRGRFRPLPDGNYRAVFTGKFAVIVPFRFATTLEVVGRDGDKVILAGSPRVPGFGRFTYHAVADANNFHASYESRRWRGEFVLWR
jgi:hypothetical protein